MSPKERAARRELLVALLAGPNYGARLTEQLSIDGVYVYGVLRMPECVS
jgi:hypothetical protein